MPEISRIEWEAFIADQPTIHLLQTSAWAELKHDFGWESTWMLCTPGDYPSIGAQILFRRLPFGLRIAYIPKGPVCFYSDLTGENRAWQTFIAELDTVCRHYKAITLILEPDFDHDRMFLPPGGFINGLQSIQPPRTILVNLEGSEEDLLSRMKQKTRYNIRLAQKKGVIIERSDHLAIFHAMMKTTGQRDNFGVHSLEYYRRAFQIFHPRKDCELFLATHDGKPLAGLMVFAYGQRAWYFYGASTDEHRELMPSYLLQWEAMRWARQRGCTQYDLWGVPDEDEQTLEANFMQRSDGLWGVYRFKRGFGGELYRSAGPFERRYRPVEYSIYQSWMRFRKRSTE